MKKDEVEVLNKRENDDRNNLEKEMIAITELIKAGEFDTEMIEEKIHKQERTTADHLAKPSNEITPDKISKPIASSSTPTKKKDKVYTPISKF